MTVGCVTAPWACVAGAPVGLASAGDVPGSMVRRVSSLGVTDPAVSTLTWTASADPVEYGSVAVRPGS